MKKNNLIRLVSIYTIFLLFSQHAQAYNWEDEEELREKRFVYEQIVLQYHEDQQFWDFRQRQEQFERETGQESQLKEKLLDKMALDLKQRSDDWQFR